MADVFDASLRSNGEHPCRNTAEQRILDTAGDLAPSSGPSSHAFDILNEDDSDLAESEEDEAANELLPIVNLQVANSVSYMQDGLVRCSRSAEYICKAEGLLGAFTLSGGGLRSQGSTLFGMGSCGAHAYGMKVAGRNGQFRFWKEVCHPGGELRVSIVADGIVDHYLVKTGAREPDGHFSTAAIVPEGVLALPFPSQGPVASTMAAPDDKEVTRLQVVAAADDGVPGEQATASMYFSTVSPQRQECAVAQRASKQLQRRGGIVDFVPVRACETPGRELRPCPVPHSEAISPRKMPEPLLSARSSKRTRQPEEIAGLWVNHLSELPTPRPLPQAAASDVPGPPEDEDDPPAEVLYSARRWRKQVDRGDLDGQDPDKRWSPATPPHSAQKLRDSGDVSGPCSREEPSPQIFCIHSPRARSSDSAEEDEEEDNELNGMYDTTLLFTERSRQAAEGDEGWLSCRSVAVDASTTGSSRSRSIDGFEAGESEEERFDSPQAAGGACDDDGALVRQSLSLEENAATLSDVEEQNLDPRELRVDLLSGLPWTLQEFVEAHSRAYSFEEIQTYWLSRCRPLTWELWAQSPAQRQLTLRKESMAARLV
eukprot:TRINITY_DN105390_c0_g1_i1.p1 TRINITY_DN105390_c0_g1~~TRINITY_DN105390_c0_g1_i1.p1  ORF type:complete len:599 (-),score=133.59 TRINITY_DN105390_c0_g1_i1:184-1980(-)